MCSFERKSSPLYIEEDALTLFGKFFYYYEALCWAHTWLMSKEYIKDALNYETKPFVKTMADREIQN